MVFCRICHSEEIENGDDELITPCKCDGTLKYVHMTCLTRWRTMGTTGTYIRLKCEVCKSDYNTPFVVVPGVTTVGLAERIALYPSRVYNLLSTSRCAVDGGCKYIIISSNASMSNRCRLTRFVVDWSTNLLLCKQIHFVYITTARRSAIIQMISQNLDNIIISHSSIRQERSYTDGTINIRNRITGRICSTLMCVHPTYDWSGRGIGDNLCVIIDHAHTCPSEIAMGVIMPLTYPESASCVVLTDAGAVNSPDHWVSQLRHNTPDMKYMELES